MDNGERVTIILVLFFLVAYGVLPWHIVLWCFVVGVPEME